MCLYVYVVCTHRWAVCRIFNVGVGVTVFVCVAVIGEAVEGRNMSNDCALSQSQKQCFITFYCVLIYLYALTFVMLHCLIVLGGGGGGGGGPKGKFSVYAFFIFIANTFYFILCIFKPPSNLIKCQSISSYSFSDDTQLLDLTAQIL